jgi:hypothetical protein
MAGATECGARNADALTIQTTTQTLRGELLSCGRSDRLSAVVLYLFTTGLGWAFRASAAVAMTAAPLQSRHRQARQTIFI